MESERLLLKGRRERWKGGEARPVIWTYSVNPPSRLHRDTQNCLILTEGVKEG